MSNFYLTTTLPYVNAQPHLGFAWEILTADFIVRYHRLLGKTCVFNTGTDEHGQKIYQKALESGFSPQVYTDKLVLEFKQLKELLNLSYTDFIRTTDSHHQLAAQEFWRRCAAHGDIYKKKYQTKYCVGCELEKTDSELVDGHCPLHPHLEIELREEENYFFRFSRYQEQLLSLYQEKSDFVLGKGKQKEIESFVRQGLQDFSISRVKEKMSWGIPVPDDDSQVMYVWFDALVNYISTLGWPDDQEKFIQFWPGVQICGKDNLRQQAAMWQAMLLSAGLPPSRKILVNGFITVDGQKMSKSLGNVIIPAALVEKYGLEATRFLIASLPVLSDDVDITDKRLADFYTANLVNGLGNLCSRLAKLASTVELSARKAPTHFSVNFAQAMDNFQTNQALNVALTGIAKIDAQLSQEKPWLTQDQVLKAQQLLPLLTELLQLIYDLQLFIPETSQFLLQKLTQDKIEPLQPLFPRLVD